MSTAANFAFLGKFPICLRSSAAVDIASGTHFDWVRDLTLAQVMAFYWNVETFTITTAASASGIFPPPGGTAYAGTANGSFTLSPLGGTGDCSSDNFGSRYIGGQGVTGWMRANADSSVPLGRVSTVPRSRVCSIAYPDAECLYLIGSDPAKAGRTSVVFEFLIAEDSVNPGKYAIGHNMSLSFAFAGAGMTLYGIYFNSRAGSGFSSGTFQICGITFPYFCGTDLPPSSAGFTTSGGTLTATSTAYTY